MLSNIRGSTSKLCSLHAARSFFGNATAMPLVSLDEEYPDVPHGTSGSIASGVHSSVAASGLRVASDSADNKVATLGIFVNAGSQAENEDNAGVNHLMEKMSFRCTNFRSDLRLYRDIENIGGKISSTYGRDFLAMSISVLPSYAEEAMQILAESILHPRFASWDVDLQKEKVRYDIEAFKANPWKIICDGLHAAAYYDTTPLGRSIYSDDNISELTPDHLRKFHEDYFNTNGMVLMGMGIEQNDLTDLANHYFHDVSTSSAPSIPVSTYVGGEYRLKSKTDEVFIAIAFDGVSSVDPLKPVSRVAASLITKRLQAISAQGFGNHYSSGGLFGVCGSATSEHASRLVDQLISEVKALSSPISSEELVIAKSHAQSEFAFEMESRQNRLNAFGQMSLLNGPTPVSNVVDLIDSVSVEQVQEFGNQLLKSNPTISSTGRVSAVPRYAEILKKVQA